MLEKVKQYVTKWQMLASEDCVITGVSGGADSICLLLILLELQKEIPFRIIAVHVNHGLRGEEANADEEFVKRFCRKRKILCEVYRADIKQLATQRKQSTEEAGRDFRRACFEQTRQAYQGTKIALAHHRNDNAETFFLNLTRGTGIKGLGGIAPVKDLTIRPLLCVGREEIEDYLREKEIPYCIDQTNASDSYTRNRIRNHILPYLTDSINPKTIEHLSETMEQLRSVQEYLEEQTQEYFKLAVKDQGGEYLVLKEAFSEVPQQLQPLLLKQVLTLVCKKEKDLEAVHLTQLRELFKKQTGRSIDLPYQMEAKRMYNGVLIRNRREQKSCAPQEIAVDLKQTKTEFDWGKYKICCEVLNKNQTNGETLEKSHTKHFDCDIIKSNISFRTRKQGDYITIYPDGRKQKLKDFFINEKVPQEERDSILLVAEGHHILWIFGYRVGCAYQTNEKTNRVLQIHVYGGEIHGRDN